MFPTRTSKHLIVRGKGMVDAEAHGKAMGLLFCALVLSALSKRSVRHSP